MTGTELAGTETRLSGPGRPDLTPEQKRLIAAAAGEIIRTTVTAQPAFLSDPTLAGAAEQIVSGSFVSLKRARHLRSCCGGLVDPPVLLGKALHDAAIRTAAEDHRFPPVSAIELEHLDMEVWILFNPAAVTAPQVNYPAILPVLFVLGGACLGVLVEAFLPRHQRWAVQVALSVTRALRSGAFRK